MDVLVRVEESSSSLRSWAASPQLSEEHAPCFGDLPAVRALPAAFYELRFDGYPTPRRHWVFLAEIVDATHSQDKRMDHRTLVADRRMQLSSAGVPVCFYYDKDAPCSFKWKDLRVGSTLCIMYAESDMLRLGTESSPGVRVDSLDYACVLPFPLSLVLQCAGRDTVCGTCGQAGGPKGLLRCAACKVERVCDATCQRNGWEKHKGGCEEMRKAREAVQALVHGVGDWKAFEQYRPFPVLGKLPVAGDLFGAGEAHGAKLH